MKARVIAYYLPQYHPIPENDKYWGKGFTEWINVAKAKPLFKGHDQPRIPADLGFYDLRLPEIREEQARLAREAGIEGFCYWHYWFGNGKELLERPFNEVVDSGKPDFPFCLGWANHEWSTKTWTASGKSKQVIAAMEYPGEKDYLLHFKKYLKAFKDERYIRVDGKLLFIIFAPLDMPDFPEFKNTWNRLAIENGLNGFHFVGVTSNFFLARNKDKGYYTAQKIDQQASINYQRVFDMGFDGINSRGAVRANVLSDGFVYYYFKRFLMQLGVHANVRIKYEDIIKHYYVKEDRWENVYPTIIPNFDRTPRAGWNTNGLWYKSTPKLFVQQIEKALKLIERKDSEHKILFLQSWNEWGEGNYMEPDQTWGHQYLDALNEALK